mgnify:FL=1
MLPETAASLSLKTQRQFGTVMDHNPLLSGDVLLVHSFAIESVSLLKTCTRRSYLLLIDGVFS